MPTVADSEKHFSKIWWTISWFGAGAIPLPSLSRMAPEKSGEFESGLEMSLTPMAYSWRLWWQKRILHMRFEACDVCRRGRAFTSFDSSTWANQATHGRHCNKWRTYRKAQQQQQQHPSSVSAHWKSKNGLTKSLKLGLFSCKILKFGQKLLDKSCLDKSFWASNLCWFYRRPG